MFCFQILSDFGENRKIGKLEKSRHFGFLHHSVGNPRRGVALHCSVGCLTVVRLRCPKGAPLVLVRICQSGWIGLGGLYI